MFDLEKLKDNNAIFWIFKYPEYRKIAAECGWAIAIHGSAVHDLDLMAMPWVENHTTADELAQRLTDTEQPNYRRPYEKSKPGDKPNGRIVYTIFVGGTYIDMNVIDCENLPHVNWDAKNDDDGPRVRLKQGAQLKRKVKAEDFIGCRNITRILNQMVIHNIDTYGDLARLTAADVMAWRNFGKGCFEELNEVMKMQGVEFRKA